MSEPGASGSPRGHAGSLMDMKAEWKAIFRARTYENNADFWSHDGGEGYGIPGGLDEWGG